MWPRKGGLWHEKPQECIGFEEKGTDCELCTGEYLVVISALLFRIIRFVIKPSPTSPLGPQVVVGGTIC